MDKCVGCNYFDRFFTRGVTKFTKLNIGRCCKVHDVVDKDGCCDKFVKRRYITYKKRATMEALNVLLKELTLIRELLEADSDAFV